jgi:hypothetical protein
MPTGTGVRSVIMVLRMDGDLRLRDRITHYLEIDYGMKR